jgi:hypothetical protein
MPNTKESFQGGDGLGITLGKHDKSPRQRHDTIIFVVKVTLSGWTVKWLSIALRRRSSSLSALQVFERCQMSKTSAEGADRTNV